MCTPNPLERCDQRGSARGAHGDLELHVDLHARRLGLRDGIGGVAPSNPLRLGEHIVGFAVLEATRRRSKELLRGPTRVGVLLAVDVVGAKGE